MAGCLILSRKTGEKIHIGDDVVVEVRRVAGNRVSLAFVAPPHVRIVRGELLGGQFDPDTENLDDHE